MSRETRGESGPNSGVTPAVNALARRPPHKLSYLKRRGRKYVKERRGARRISASRCAVATQIRFLEITDFVTGKNERDQGSSLGRARRRDARRKHGDVQSVASTLRSVTLIISHVCQRDALAGLGNALSVDNVSRDSDGIRMTAVNDHYTLATPLNARYIPRIVTRSQKFRSTRERVKAGRP